MSLDKNSSGLPAPSNVSEEVLQETSLQTLCLYGGCVLLVAALTYFAWDIGKHYKEVWGTTLILCAGLAWRIYWRTTTRQSTRSIFAGATALVVIVVSAAGALIIQDAQGGLWYTPASLVDAIEECDAAGCPPEGMSFTNAPLADRIFRTPVAVIGVASLASLIALFAIRFLPLVAVSTLGIWYVISVLSAPSTEEKARLILLTCSVTWLMIGWWFDKTRQENVGFWLNKLGAWGSAAGLLALFDGGPGMRTAFVLLNCIGMLLALYLRRPGAIFGFAVGVAALLVVIQPEEQDAQYAFLAMLVAAGILLVRTSQVLHLRQKDLSSFLPGFLARWRPEARHESVLFGSGQLLAKLSLRARTG